MEICLPLLIVFYHFLCYIINMTMTQTVEIPPSRRLTIDVPREIPTKSVIITFAPAISGDKNMEKSEARDIELFKLHADRLNAEALDVLSYQVPLWDDEEA